MKHTTSKSLPKASGYVIYELNFYEPGSNFSWHPGCVAQRVQYNQWRQNTPANKIMFLKAHLSGVRGIIIFRWKEE